MSLNTLNDIFFAVVERQQDFVMMYRQDGQWVSISSQEFFRRVIGLARALESWGISKGHRIAILSENRPEWALTDFACLLLGAVTVPIYSTLTGEQSVEILRDSGARIIAVSTEQQLRKLLSIRDRTAVEKILVMDDLNTEGAIPIHKLMKAGPVERDPKFETRARSVKPEDLATIIYTSGTTGTPKGVMLTHGNIASNISYSLQGFDRRPGEISISFLPLSHVTARHADLALLYHGVILAYCPFIEQLSQALLEVKPTVFLGVPRVYEKIYAQVEHKAKRFPTRALYRWALHVGRAHKSETVAGKTPHSLSWKLAARLVFSQVRAGLGGRVRIFISGGAPLGRELAEWFATIGIRIHEGYGLTETSPVIAVNTPLAHKLGTVGEILPNIEVRIADDGEILVRGPSVFQGYWNRPEETTGAFVDGWFKTGDIGTIDRDGFLSITDRKKDLIKTSGGKFIAPQPIENSLKHNPLVGTPVIIGDKRKFPALIISPSFPALEQWARAHGIAFSSSQDLIRNKKVQELYDGIVAEVNQNLARFEKLKKVLLVPDEFSAESGDLTPTMKLRRRMVEERYHDLIEEMYKEAENTPSPEAVDRS